MKHALLVDAEELLNSLHNENRNADPKHKRTLSIAVTTMEQVIHRLKDYEAERKENDDVW